jgi:hypothetical protein
MMGGLRLWWRAASGFLGPNGAGKTMIGHGETR